MSPPPPDPFHILHNTSGPVTSLTTVKFNKSNDCRLVSGSESGIITIWSLEASNILNIHRFVVFLSFSSIFQSFRALTNWKAHESPVIWLGVTRNTDSILISQGRTDTIKLWTSENKLISSIENTHEGFCKCDIEDAIIAVPSVKSGVVCYDIKDVGSLKKRNSFIMEKEGTVMAVKLTPNVIVISYESGYVCCLSKDTSEIKASTRIDCMPTCIAFSAHQEKILLGTSSEKLFVLDETLKTKQEILLTNPGLNAISVRPDGRIFTSAGWDRRIRIFGGKSHKKLCVLQCHDNSLNCLTFTVEHSPCLLAAGSNDSLISLWNVYS